MQFHKYWSHVPICGSGSLAHQQHFALFVTWILGSLRDHGQETVHIDETVLHALQWQIQGGSHLSPNIIYLVFTISLAINDIEA